MVEESAMAAPTQPEIPIQPVEEPILSGLFAQPAAPRPGARGLPGAGRPGRE